MLRTFSYFEYGMGIDAHSVRLLLHAQSQGVDFSRIATIGRQRLFASTAELRRELERFGHADARGLAKRLRRADGFAEELLGHLGGQHVESFDCSDFEGATRIHDFNQPIPDDWKTAFSAVIDGGSLEHVFDFPTAIKNCMELVRPGGHFLSITPANNYLGHGFYQFSPELFFRVFNPASGFELQDVMLFETAHGSAWYAVRDPASLGCRVRLANCRPTLMAVLARRISAEPIVLRAPQQSDYVSVWNGAKRRPGQARARHALTHMLRRMMPPVLAERLRHWWWLLAKPKFKKKYFQRVRWPEARTAVAAEIRPEPRLVLRPGAES